MPCIHYNSTGEFRGVANVPFKIIEIPVCAYQLTEPMYFIAYKQNGIVFGVLQSKV